mgnify:CR=1 FL=1
MTIETVSPESQGMSSERLGRLQSKLQGYIDEQSAAGFVSLIARNGQPVHFEAIGNRDLENQLPMEKDSLFRLYSLTKPITAVALMMLYEQGKFQLNDPLHKYIAEFADTKVVSENGDLAKLETPITIHHLLTHTAGMLYNHSLDNTPEDAANLAYYADPTISLEDKVRWLAGLPVACQPGTEWTYGYASVVCSYLVELFSGMPFAEYLEKEIFVPLGMCDTSFYINSDNAGRLAAPYSHNADKSLIPYHNQGVFSRDYLVPTKSPNGGHGLVSTAEDYFRFSQMILNKGEFNGTRLLGRKTVEYMMMNHLKPELLPMILKKWAMQGYGFGLGFGLMLDTTQSRVLNSVGSYIWGGAGSTLFVIDPQEQLIAILMTQMMDNKLPLLDEFQVLTYQAITD